MHDACLAISRGDLDVVLVTGAEAMYARTLARRARAAWLAWASQPEGTPPPVLFGVDRPGATELEMNRGVILPVHAYPLFENALRGADGMDARGARRPHRGAVVPLQRGGRRESRRLDPHAAHGRRDRPPRSGQPDGLVPLSQAVHGQHAGRPGSGIHRVLGGGGPRRGSARGTLGLPARRGGRQRPLVHLAAARAAPLPGHPARRRRGAGAGRARHRRRRLRRPLLVLPGRGADGRPRTRACGRRPDASPDVDRRAHVRRRAGEQLHRHTASPGPSARCERRRGRRHS